MIRLRADLTRLRDDRPEFAAIRVRASALIDQGEFDTARAVLREGRDAARQLRKEFSRSEAEFLVDEARVNSLQSDYASARTNLEEATHLDSDNCWAWIELGDLWILLGSLSEAERAFRAAIRGATATGNERDLSISRNKIGDVQRAQGDLAAALTSYQASLAIRDRFAKANPGNAGWQRDLSVSHNKIGDVQRVQGDLGAALTNYQASLAIADRLAKAEPGNAGWQRDLALSFGHTAAVHASQHNHDHALSQFKEGQGIIVRLMRQSRTNATLPTDLAWFDSQIKILQK